MNLAEIKKWLPRLAIVGLTLFFVSRGGGAAVAGLFKIAFPLIVAYTGYKVIRNLLTLEPGSKNKESFSRNSDPNDTTIEICSTCGHQVGNPDCSKCKS